MPTLSKNNKYFWILSVEFIAVLLEFLINTQAIGEVLGKSQKLMTHEPNEFDRPFDNDNSFALDNSFDNNVADNNITDSSANLDSNYNSLDRPWQDNNFAGGDNLGLVQEDYHNSVDRESNDWQNQDTSSYDIYADSYQHSSTESHFQSTSWEQEYNSQYIQDNSIAENNLQQTSWEQDYHTHHASPRSGSLDSHNIELANDHFKQAKEARDLADYRMNASKEFAESNMPDSVNKYLDKTADALKEAEKHEAEAKKLLDKK